MQAERLAEVADSEPEEVEAEAEAEAEVEAEVEADSNASGSASGDGTEPVVIDIQSDGEVGDVEATAVV